MLSFDSSRRAYVIEFDRVIERDGVKRRVRRRRRLPAGTSEHDARVIAAKFEADLFAKHHAVLHADGWQQHVEDLIAARGSWLDVTLSGARTRDAKRGRRCTITRESLAQLLIDSGGRCAVTGVKFSTDKLSPRGSRPLMYSLDRIENAKGYELGNVRIVAVAANIAMSHWGEDVFAELAMGYAFNRFCATEFFGRLTETSPPSRERKSRRA